MAMPAEEPTERPDLREVEEDVYDPVAAVANEAKPQKGFPFTAGGEVFRAKAPQQLGRKAIKRIDLLEADESTSAAAFMDEMFRALLGPEQFERFDEVADLTLTEMRSVLDEAAKYYGISAPESPASTGSSKSKKRR